MNDIELCQELMTRAEEYQKRKEREFAIDELEKIKGKVIACFNQEDNVFSSNFNLGIEMAISVIDKSIIELKGENNEI